MGGWDKGIRFLMAILIGILYFTGVLSGTIALIGLLVAVVLIGTSLFGSCPLYLPFGFSTNQKKPDKS